jgi:hypothetical protein
VQWLPRQSGPPSICTWSGFYVSKDGSENGKINLHKNIQDYTVPFPDNSSDTESDVESDSD